MRKETRIGPSCSPLPPFPTAGSAEERRGGLGQEEQGEEDFEPAGEGRRKEEEEAGVHSSRGCLPSCRQGWKNWWWRTEEGKGGCYTHTHTHVRQARQPARRHSTAQDRRISATVLGGGRGGEEEVSVGNKERGLFFVKDLQVEGGGEKKECLSQLATENTTENIADVNSPPPKKEKITEDCTVQHCSFLPTTTCRYAVRTSYVQ